MKVNEFLEIIEKAKAGTETLRNDIRKIEEKGIGCDALNESLENIEEELARVIGHMAMYYDMKKEKE